MASNSAEIYNMKEFHVLFSCLTLLNDDSFVTTAILYLSFMTDVDELISDDKEQEFRLVVNLYVDL